MIDQQLEGLSSPSPQCWPLHSARACAITCDPSASTWLRVGNTPRLCRPFCERYFQTCLASRGDGSYGIYQNASVWCTIFGATSNCLHVPEPSPALPPIPPPDPMPPPRPPDAPPAPPPPISLEIPVWVWVFAGALGVLALLAVLLRLR